MDGILEDGSTMSMSYEMRLNGILRTLHSSNFNYPGWKVDKKLVENHAPFDEDAAVFRLDVMKRRQEVTDGTCNHPIFLQILDKEWAFPGNESDVVMAVNYFYHGRDNFVHKVLREGDQKEMTYLNHPDAQETDSDECDHYHTRPISAMDRSSADSTVIMVMKKGGIVGSLKRVQEFNRRTRQILEDDEEEEVDIRHRDRFSGKGESLSSSGHINRYQQNSGGVISESSNLLVQRRKDMRDGCSRHPLFLAIKQRAWSYPDNDEDKKAALRYFRFGQDSMTEQTIRVADQKEIDWKATSTQKRATPRGKVEISEKDELPRDINESIDHIIVAIKNKLSKEKDHVGRRGDAVRSRRQQRFNSVDHPLIHTIQQRAWTYPANEEDETAAKYNVQNGLNKMAENILKDGDDIEGSCQYSQSGKHFDEGLVALDSLGFSYPGWQNDLDEMKAKQNRHDRKGGVGKISKISSPEGHDDSLENVVATSKTEKSQPHQPRARKQIPVRVLVGNEQRNSTTSIKQVKQKKTKTNTKAPKATKAPSDTKAPKSPKDPSTIKAPKATKAPKTVATKAPKASKDPAAPKATKARTIEGQLISI